jgi:hypothetical protein
VLRKGGEVEPAYTPAPRSERPRYSAQPEARRAEALFRAVSRDGKPAGTGRARKGSE